MVVVVVVVVVVVAMVQLARSSTSALVFPIIQETTHPVRNGVGERQSINVP